MGVLDNLIRVKASAKEDDLLKMLDEVLIYEKLSADEKLRDLKNSEVTRKKCPLLAAFVDGDMYAAILADLVANVYLQIENRIPQVLATVSERSSKQQKQMEILQHGITHVGYMGLTDYDHEMMKGHLSAVFTAQVQDIITAAIIVKGIDGYVMYHGTYQVKENAPDSYITHKPVLMKGTHGILTLNNYSVLGNNGYPFGYYTDWNGSRYDVMLGPDRVMYLVGGGRTITHMMSDEENNVLNRAKQEAQEFAKAVVSVVESVV